MKRKYLFNLFILLISLSFIFSCQYFGDPFVGAKGVVRDKDGKPLAGVNLLLESNNRISREDKTKEDGKYDIGMIGAKPEETKLTFSKEGYKPYILNFEKLGDIEIDVTLESEQIEQ